MIKICKRCGEKFHKRREINVVDYCKKCDFYLRSKNRRLKLRKEHRCLSCGKKVKPILIYH